MEDRASPTAVRTLPVSSYLVDNHFFELCYFSLVALGTLSWYAVGVHAMYCSFIKDSPFFKVYKAIQHAASRVYAYGARSVFAGIRV